MSRVLGVLCGLFWATILVSIPNMGVIAQPAVEKVVIIPFSLNSEKDVTFLRDGIVDMLSSRLSGDNVHVVSKEETSGVLSGISTDINEALALDIGRRLKAGHVLFGSITVFGDSVSVDAKMLDTTGKKQPLSFFTQTASLGALIPKIDTFASQINDQIFNRSVAPSSPATEESSTTSAALTDDIHAHPEKLLQPGTGGDQGDVNQKTATGQSGSRKATSAPNPLFTEAQEGKKTQPFWKSRNFNRLINGIAIGDIDGDGAQEVVLTESHKVHIYRLKENRLIKIHKVIENKRLYNVGVDLADVNGNGVPELFLSRLNTVKRGLSSSIYEFNGKMATPISRKKPWFYRISKGVHDQPPILLGQRKKGKDAFTAAVYEMSWNGSDYEPHKRVIRENRTNALGVARGDLLNRGEHNSVGYSTKETIQLFGISGNKVIYTANNRYGGTYRDITVPKTDPQTDRDYEYLPARMIIDDIDGDGRNELITTRNFDVARKLLTSQRRYTKGQMVCLNWDGFSLNEVWSTPKLAGYISDFTIVDLDGDGKKDLVAVWVLKSGRLLGTKPISCLIVYPIG